MRSNRRVATIDEREDTKDVACAGAGAVWGAASVGVLTALWTRRQ